MTATIQLQRSGFALAASPEELDSMAREFEHNHALHFDNFLEPSLLARVQEAVERSQFVLRQHDNIGVEQCMTRDSLAVHMLMLLANSPPLLAFVERISGGPPLGFFMGRIYRYPPSQEYFDGWHDDVREGRRVAMSINLSAEPYEGGVLELREDERTIGRLANTGPGTALLFRIRDGLQHKITPVTGSKPKTAFAGWFIEAGQAAPYLDVVRGTGMRAAGTGDTS